MKPTTGGSQCEGLYRHSNGKSTLGRISRWSCTKSISLKAINQERVRIWNLRQEESSVTEYDRLFVQLSRYAPHLVDIGEKRSEKFRRGLRHKIGMPLASQGVLTYAESLNRARAIEAMMPEEKKVPTEAPNKKRKRDDLNENNNNNKGKRK